MSILYYSWEIKGKCTFSAMKEKIKIEDQNFSDYQKKYAMIQK